MPQSYVDEQYTDALEKQNKKLKDELSAAKYKANEYKEAFGMMLSGLHAITKAAEKVLDAEVYDIILD